MKTVEFKLSQSMTVEMIEIPAGSFLMGISESKTEKRANETPPHEVNIESFYLGKFSVIQLQWFAVIDLLRNKKDI